MLYISLCEIANRDKNHSNPFKVTDRQLGEENGLAPRTIRDARPLLIENGLVKCTQQPGQSYRYTLLPQKLEWVPRPNRPREKRRPRGMAATRVPF